MTQRNADIRFIHAVPQMGQVYRDGRKIDPARVAVLGDNTPNDQNRVEIGRTQLAYRQRQRTGLVLPDLKVMQRYRWNRPNQHIVDPDHGGLLIFDPLNIRYATDSTNMQL